MMVRLIVFFDSRTPTRGINFGRVLLTEGPQHVAGDGGTGGVQSQLPAEPYQGG